MKKFARELSRMFSAPKQRQPDTQRREREEAKRLAAECGIEIERFRPADGGGMNVWPPKAIADTPADPFDGDHYCNDWKEAAHMVRTYASLVTAAQEAA